MRRVLVVLGVMLAAALVAACGGSSGDNPSSSEGADEPLTVGASLSLSGEFAEAGVAAKQGYEVWAEYVNEHGGLLGRPVKLEIVDDASDSRQVVTNYQELVGEDEVDLLLGPFSSLLTKPASVVAHRYGYAFFTGLGGGEEITSQGFDNVFNVVIDTSDLMKSFAETMLALPEPPATAAYVALDNPFTVPQVERAKELLEEGGVETKLDEIYGPSTSDFKPLSTKVADADADVLVAGSGLPELTAIMEGIEQQGYNPKAMIAAAGADEGKAFLDAVGENSAGVMAPGVWSANLKTPLNDELVRIFVERFGGKPEDIGTTTGQAFAAAQVGGEVLEEVGEVNQEKLIEAARAKRYGSVVGPVELNEAGENIATSGLTFQWQDGKFLTIVPEDQSEAQLLYPKPEWVGK